jgi:hypothetical protein
MPRRDPPPGELLSIAEAADLLGVSLPTLRRWDVSGKIPCTSPSDQCISNVRACGRNEVAETDRRGGERCLRSGYHTRSLREFVPHELIGAGTGKFDDLQCRVEADCNDVSRAVCWLSQYGGLSS